MVLWFRLKVQSHYRYSMMLSIRSSHSNSNLHDWECCVFTTQISLWSCKYTMLNNRKLFGLKVNLYKSLRYWQWTFFYAKSLLVWLYLNGEDQTLKMRFSKWGTDSFKDTFMKNPTSFIMIVINNTFCINML